MFAGMLSSAAFDRGRMAAACSGGYLEATDAAEYLVRKGMPFRTAHETAAALVRSCIDGGRSRLADCPIEEFRRHSPLFDSDIYAALEPEAMVAARNLPGGPAPEEVRRQIAALQKLFTEA
jgi:argininosuccinate lyase